MILLLHVGPCETGGEQFRSTLYEARDRFPGGFMRFITQAYVQEHFSEPLDRASSADGPETYDSAVASMARRVSALIKGHARKQFVVLSDDRILGPLFDEDGRRGMFPHAGERIAAIKKAVPGSQQIDVCVCLRGYDEILSLDYARRRSPDMLRRREHIVDGALAMTRGWREVVAEICEIVGAERTIVWTHDAFERQPRRVYEHLFGGEAKRLFTDLFEALPPLTAKGVVVLERSSDLLSVCEHEQLVERLSRYDFDPPDAVFSLFDASETARLKARYESDLADIAAMGCRLVLSPQH